MKNVTNSGTPSPSVEVTAQATRRSFSAAYKKRILDEVAACTQTGEIGALLRREGLYSSHLTKWRQQAERGEMVGLAPKRRGPEPSPVDPRDVRLVEMERALNKMTARAERAEALVELQKKVAELLGLALSSEPK